MVGARTEPVTTGDKTGHRRVSVRLLLPLLNYARTTSVDLVALLSENEIDPAILASRTAFVPASAALRLFESAERLLGSDVGFRAVESVDYRFLEFLRSESEFVVLQLLLTAQTVGEGLSPLVEAYDLSHDLFSLAMEPRADGVFLRATMNGPRPTPTFIEVAFGCHTAPIAALTTPAVRPRIELAHALRPGIPPSPLRGVDVRFGAPSDGLFFSHAALQARMRTANATLAARALEVARELRQGLGASASARVRQHIAALLEEGHATAVSAARAMGVSVRHLARLLAAEGTSHRELLDEVRVEHASRLQAQGLAASEIATRLGYSDVTAYRRAQRRWPKRG